MGLLLLDRTKLEVKSEGETLALFESGERRGTVPFKLIDRCVINGSQTRLDSGVLIKLADAGVTTVLISNRYPRRAALVLGPQHNDASVRIAQALRVVDASWCQAWALGLVRAKLARQKRALHTMQLLRPDARKPTHDAQRALNAIHATLATFATTGHDLPTLDTLRGLEGAAARAYFGGLASVMPHDLRFTGRNRRPPRDPVNACLSLGYTLLHSQAVHACGVAGLDPLLGFYHRPAFGRESMASDLIEALRPAIDLWVWELLRNRTLTEDHFTRTPESDACLLGKTGRGIFYASWNKNVRPWQRWLRIKAQALARDLRGAGMQWVNLGGEDDEEC